MQGEEQMPRLVKTCYESWKTVNPDYEVILLHEDNFRDYITIDPAILNNKQITIQAFSDILRINLLKRHGGVWVDATCFCVQPLSSWVPEHLKTGFFAFSSPGSDRLVSSWFLIGEKDNYIIGRWADRVNNYLLDNLQLKNAKNLGKWQDAAYRFMRRANRTSLISDTSIWFSYFFRKVVKVYPYFFFHYLFNELYNTDTRFRQEWEATPTISADIPHKMLRVGFDTPLTDEIREEIDQRKAPVYKLSHKRKFNQDAQDSTINYLLRIHQANGV